MIKNKWVTYPRAHRNFIPELTDKGEVPKQLEFFEGGENKEFEDKGKLIGLLTDSIKFLEFLKSEFSQKYS